MIHVGECHENNADAALTNRLAPGSNVCVHWPVRTYPAHVSQLRPRLPEGFELPDNSAFIAAIADQWPEAHRLPSLGGQYYLRSPFPGVSVQCLLAIAWYRAETRARELAAEAHSPVDRLTYRQITGNLWVVEILWLVYHSAQLGVEAEWALLELA